MTSRWWIYQRERFPLAAHAPLVLAFSFSAVGFSVLIRGGDSFAHAWTPVIAFVVSLCSFLQLRIADEFKDAADDAAFRPYRPVPRGLVTLSELRLVGIGAALIQILLSSLLSWKLVGILAIVWLYFSLMSVEFFAPRWLKARPVIYLLSHMFIMPLVDLFATACDWLVVGAEAHPGLICFLIVSYFNGMVLEIGRKLRVPADEEPGVETYTALWGLKAAAIAWLLSMALSAVAALWAASYLNFSLPLGCALAIVFVLSAAAAFRLRNQRKGDGRLCEYASALWTLVLYLGLGAIPYLVLT